MLPPKCVWNPPHYEGTATCLDNKTGWYLFKYRWLDNMGDQTYEFSSKWGTHQTVFFFWFVVSLENQPSMVPNTHARTPRSTNLPLTTTHVPHVRRATVDSPHMKQLNYSHPTTNSQHMRGITELLCSPTCRAFIVAWLLQIHVCLLEPKIVGSRECVVAGTPFWGCLRVRGSPKIQSTHKTHQAALVGILFSL